MAKQELQRRTHETPCVAVSTAINDIKNIKEDLGEHASRMDGIEDKIDNIRDLLNTRLPLWATLAFASMTAAIGWLANALLK